MARKDFLKYAKTQLSSPNLEPWNMVLPSKMKIRRSYTVSLSFGFSEAYSDKAKTLENEGSRRGYNTVVMDAVQVNLSRNPLRLNH